VSKHFKAYLLIKTSGNEFPAGVMGTKITKAAYVFEAFNYFSDKSA